jgi:hypothetical protein
MQARPTKRTIKRAGSGFEALVYDMPNYRPTDRGRLHVQITRYDDRHSTRARRLQDDLSRREIFDTIVLRVAWDTIHRRWSCEPVLGIFPWFLFFEMHPPSYFFRTLATALAIYLVLLGSEIK